MKPELYIEGEDGHFRNWWFPGSDGGNLRDAGPANILPLNVATMTDGHGVVAGGTEITGLGDLDPPELASTGTIVDSAINANVYGAEWTGTGSSEQITTNYRSVRVQQGQTLTGGAWVYLDAGGPRDIDIRWYGFDSTGAVTESNNNLVTVTDKTWTYISSTGLVDLAATIHAAVYVQANGNQSIGDKIYIGAFHLGIDTTDWCYPITANRDELDLRFSAKIIGDGAILSNRTPYAAGTNGDAFHIEALNEGFHVQVGYRATDDTLTTVSYTTATNLYDYGKWYDFRWTCDSSTAAMNFYILRNGRWDLIDTGDAGAGGTFFNTSYGIDTLDTGLLSGGSHMVLGSFGMFNGEFGWRVRENIAEDIIGSALDIVQDQSVTSHNHSLFLDHSGWIINAASTDKGGLQLPYRSELKFGTSDFTLVTAFTGVGNTNLRSLYKDDNVRFGAPSTAGNTEFVVGDNTLTLSSNLFDGVQHIVIAEREYGVELRAYVDGAAATTDPDTSFDLNDTSPINIGFETLSDSATFLSANIGLVITFDRLLEEFERDDLEFWIEDGFPVDNEPDWLRDAAVLYMNPNDPVQQSEYRDGDYSSYIIDSGPIGYWRLGESSGTTAVDSSGNGHDGLYENGPILGVNGALEYDDDTAVRFDGVDDKVTISDTPALNPSTEITLESWVYWIGSGAGAYPFVMAKGHHQQYELFAGNSNTFRPWMRLVTNGGTQDLHRDAISALPTEQWVHVACTVDLDRGVSELYIDGNLVNEDTTVGTSITTTTYDLYLANSADGTLYPFNGRLDESAVYDRALSAGEIRTHYDLGKNGKRNLLNLGVEHPDTLYVRYRFTSDDGASNPQLSHNKLSVDNRGSELDISEQEFERSISGLVVDWHELGSDWLNNEWTVSWWMEQGESTAEQHVFGQDGHWYVRVDNTSDVVFVVNGAVELTAAGVLTEYLQMCTLTYDGTNLTLFIDDTQVAQTGTIASSSPQTDLEYGTLGTGANEFTGRLGPLMIAREAWSGPQVQALFETTGLSKTPTLNETYTLSDSFDDISLNWGSL